MKKVVLLFAALSCLAFSAQAQTKKDGTPDMRYSSNRQAYGSTYSAPAPAPAPSYSAPAASPYYGGGTHTESHGGTYQGGEGGSSHKGGTYTNPDTYNTYGRHKSN